MIVLSDPRNFQCSREEAQLMQAAETVDSALQILTPEEADFMVRHHDEIKSFLTHGATAIGIGEAMFSHNLESVKNLLIDIEHLHQRSFRQYGHLRSDEFFAERKRLFTQLDTQLTGLTKKSTGFPDHPNIKRALGISSRNLVHQWSKAGTPGTIPGYATHINGITKTAKYVQYGGWVGTAVGARVSYMKVQDVCTAGNAQACTQVKFTETGSFLGSFAGGTAVGAGMTGAATGTICVALGVPTAGTGLLLCGLVVVGAASFGAGVLGGKIGEGLGDMIYKAQK